MVSLSEEVLSKNYIMRFHNSVTSVQKVRYNYFEKKAIKVLKQKSLIITSLLTNYGFFGYQMKAFFIHNLLG